MTNVMDTHRFQDKNYRLSGFEGEIFVECPKCQKRAVVTKDEPDNYFSERTLKCPNCFYHQIGRPKTFHITLNCHCSHCAAAINVDLQNVNDQKETIAVKCRACGKTEDYQPRNQLQEWIFNSRKNIVDNYFGAKLWLIENFGGNDFWALNYEHLDYLKQYIVADLRERNGRSYWTMVEKLPNWIKLSKNREKLIKVITKLEHK